MPTRHGAPIFNFRFRSKLAERTVSTCLQTRWLLFTIESRALPLSVLSRQMLRDRRAPGSSSLGTAEADITLHLYFQQLQRCVSASSYVSCKYYTRRDFKPNEGDINFKRQWDSRSWRLFTIREFLGIFIKILCLFISSLQLADIDVAFLFSTIAKLSSASSYVARF